MGDDAAQYLCDALKHNSSLTVLGMGGTLILYDADVTRD